MSAESISWIDLDAKLKAVLDYPDGDPTWISTVQGAIGIDSWDVEVIRLEDLPRIQLASKVPGIVIISERMELVGSEMGCEKYVARYGIVFHFPMKGPGQGAEIALRTCKHIAEAMRLAIYKTEPPYGDILTVERLDYRPEYGPQPGSVQHGAAWVIVRADLTRTRS